MECHPTFGMEDVLNIFVLDRDPIKAAEYHCDKHVGKMLVEAAQLLSTAHHVLDGDDAPEGIYMPTHRNHPCAVWVRQNMDNYDWVWGLGFRLGIEFERRYGKTHKTQEVISKLTRGPYALGNPEGGVCWEAKDFALAMPDKYKTDDPVESYRAYYRAEKAHIAKWEHGPTPPWWVQDVVPNQ